MPGPPFGLCAIPRINSRFPLWDDPDLPARIVGGQGFLPDAEEGKRATVVTTVLDAVPLPVLRVQGPTWVPMLTAIALSGVFILPVFKLRAWTVVAGALFLVALLHWLWTGPAVIPEKGTKDIGDGRQVPLYRAGPAATGWWAMFITMTGDLTAFLALVFGYFCFWTIHDDFPPPGMTAPGPVWTLACIGGGLAAWGATLGARLVQAKRRVGLARGLLGLGIVSTIALGAGLAAGPWAAGLDPASHAYPATVWVLVLWTLGHLGAGIIIQGYRLARSLAGRMTPTHDADL